MRESVNVVNLSLLALVLFQLLHLELMVRNVPNLHGGITTPRKHNLLLQNGVVVKSQNLDWIFVHDEALDVPHLDARLLPVMDTEVITP